MIGAGTGILAKTAVELMGSGNIFNEISTAFIAGFAGLSYIRERQNKELGLDGGSDDSNRKLDPGKVVMLREDWPGDTKGNTGQEKPKAETTKDSQEKQ